MQIISATVNWYIGNTYTVPYVDANISSSSEPSVSLEVQSWKERSSFKFANFWFSKNQVIILKVLQYVLSVMNGMMIRVHCCWCLRVFITQSRICSVHVDCACILELFVIQMEYLQNKITMYSSSHYWVIVLLHLTASTWSRPSTRSPRWGSPTQASHAVSASWWQATYATWHGTTLQWNTEPVRTSASDANTHQNDATRRYVGNFIDIYVHL